MFKASSFGEYLSKLVTKVTEFSDMPELPATWLQKYFAGIRSELTNMSSFCWKVFVVTGFEGYICHLVLFLIINIFFVCFLIVLLIMRV